MNKHQAALLLTVLAFAIPSLALAKPPEEVVIDDGTAFPQAAVTTVNMLLCGDSITEGYPAPPGFRDDLRAILAGDPQNTFNFVGSSGSAPLQGHFQGGRRIDEFYPPAFGGTGTFDTTPDLGPPATPNLVAVHLGTNDLNSQSGPYGQYSDNHGVTLNNTQSAEIAEFLRYLLRWQDGTQSNQLHHFVLSLVIPMRNRTADVEAFNSALIAMSEDFAEGTVTGTPVRVALADHYSRFIANPALFTFGPGDWMSDSLHPNSTGYAEMAQVYGTAISQAAGDTSPPLYVDDLSIASAGQTTITLTFTASGDDGITGRAARYDLRMSQQPINAANFGLAMQVENEPAPAPFGAGETMQVAGLLPGTTYYFAVKVVDDGGNRAAISNVASATTDGSPTVTVTLRQGVNGYSGAEDNSMIDLRNLDNKGNSGTFEVGLHGGTVDLVTDLCRSLIRFDLSSIPAGANITDARLELYNHATDSASPSEVAAYRLTKRWGEGTRSSPSQEVGASCWRAARLYELDWSAPGADAASNSAQNNDPSFDRYATPEAVTTLTGANRWYTWDLTRAVTNWHGGQWQNDGILLRTVYETGNTRRGFYATEASNSSLRPTLVITYSTGGGGGNLPPIAVAGGPYAAGVGEAIAFNGTASSDPEGQPLTYAWNFGDGATATGATPSHAYSSAGTYTVSLVVNDGAQNSAPATTTATVTSTNAPPIAVAGGPYSGTAGQPIAFDGRGSSDPEGQPLTYAWNFGDGATATGATPSHAYSSAGTYTVSLVVNDGAQNSAPATTTATVTSTNAPPIAVAGGPYSGTAGQPIAFDGRGSSDPEGQPLTYAWNFGDGATATGATPSHAYSSAGTYTVSLVVNDGAQNSAPATTTADVQPAGGGGATIVLKNGLNGYTGTDDAYMIGSSNRVDANTGGRYEVRIGKRNNTPAQPGVFRFDLSSIPAGSTIQSATLRLYNFNSSTSATTVFGAYRLVKLWNEGTQSGPRNENGAVCWSSAQLGILPWSGAGASAASDAATNNDPSFDRKATPEAVTTIAGASRWYEWNVTSAVQQWVAGSWNNNGILIQPVDLATQSERGFYSSEASNPDLRPELVVTIGDGGPVNLPPIADAGGPYTGTPGQPVAFNGSGSSDPEGQPLTYSWTFGDGATATGATPTHAYAAAGSYTVTLVVNDGGLNSQPATTTASIGAGNQPPIADAGGPYTGTPGQPVAFNGSGSSDPEGQPLTYSWTFGDGATATGATPTHAYAAAGSYTVTLVVNDGGLNSQPATTTASIIQAGGTIVLREGLDGYSGTDDNYLLEGSNVNSNAGGRYEVGIGKRGSTPPKPGLVRFDLASIPAGTAVVSARLKLYNFSTVTSSAMDFAVYRLVKDWAEGTQSGPRTEVGASCWNYARYSSEPWSGPGASAASDGAVNNDPNFDRTATPLAVTTIHSSGAWVEWDVTTAVQQWVAGNWNNNGLWIGPVQTALDSERRFYASEHSNSALRPTLEITLATPIAPAGGELALLRAESPLAAPEVTQLMGSFPNPFRASTSVRYELATPGQVRLRIYDVQGRLVRRLVEEEQGIGAYEIAWDGQSETGGRAAAGTYFMRLEAPGIVDTKRTLLLR